MYKLYKLTTFCLALGAFSTTVYADNNDLPDPTKPLTHKNTISSKKIGNNIEISAIYVGENNNSTVLIDKQAFKIGDKIINYTIITIDREGIILKNDDGSTLRIDMPILTVKKPSTINKKREGKS